jgi:hypothetical protein
MTIGSPLTLSPRMKEAIEEIKQLILHRFPEAKFDIGEGEDPCGIHVITTVDLEDLGEVMDVYRDRIVDMQVDEGLPLYFIPTRPIERSLEMMRRRDTVTPWIRRA